MSDSPVNVIYYKYLTHYNVCSQITICLLILNDVFGSWNWWKNDENVFSICCPRLTYKCRVILMAELSVMTLEAYINGTYSFPGILKTSYRASLEMLTCFLLLVRRCFTANSNSFRHVHVSLIGFAMNLSLT